VTKSFAWVQFRNRFSGTCVLCQSKVEAFSDCFYNRGRKKLMHEECYQAMKAPFRTRIVTVGEFADGLESAALEETIWSDSDSDRLQYLEFTNQKLNLYRSQTLQKSDGNLQAYGSVNLQDEWNAAGLETALIRNIFRSDIDDLLNFAHQHQKFEIGDWYESGDRPSDETVEIILGPRFSSKFESLHQFLVTFDHAGQSGIALLGMSAESARLCNQISISYSRDGDEVDAFDCDISWNELDFEVSWINHDGEYVIVPFWYRDEIAELLPESNDQVTLGSLNGEHALDAMYLRIRYPKSLIDLSEDNAQQLLTARLGAFDVTNLAPEVERDPMFVSSFVDPAALSLNSGQIEGVSRSEDWWCRAAVVAGRFNENAETHYLTRVCPSHRSRAREIVSTSEPTLISSWPKSQTDLLDWKTTSFSDAWMRGKSFLGRPWRWQVCAYEAWIAHGRHGLIEAATGAGKSMLGVAAALEAVEDGYSVVIVVPTKILQDQWLRNRHFGHRELLSLGGDPGDAYPRGFPRPGRIVVAVAKTLLEHPEYVNGMGDKSLVIFDEVHNYGGDHYRSIFDPRFSRRLGLTATLSTAPGRLPIFYNYFSGSPVYSYSLAQARGDNVVVPFNLILIRYRLDPDVQMVYSRLIAEETQIYMTLQMEGLVAATNQLTDRELLELSSSAKYARYARRLIELGHEKDAALEQTADRTRAIRSLSKLIRRRRKTVIFTDAVSLAKETADTLRSEDVSCSVIDYRVVGEQRLSIIRATSSGTIDAVVAPRVLDEGIDIPGLKLGINLGRSRRHLQLVQRVGRVLRKCEEKGIATMVFLVARDTEDDPYLAGNRALQRSPLKFILDAADDHFVFDAEDDLSELDF
jgi:superfamily II DNA or RNA helicase